MEMFSRKLAISLVAILSLWLVVATSAQTAYPADIVINPDQFTVLTGSRVLADLPLTDRNDYYNDYPAMLIENALTYDAVITTDVGAIRLRLFDDEAPLAVNNFVFLALEGYYDNNAFQRVVEDWVAQAGDVTDDGFGGPGYFFATEETTLAWDRPGQVGWANPNASGNGGQFFITSVAADLSIDRFSVFGQMIDGQDVFDAITIRQRGTATVPTMIERVDIYVAATPSIPPAAVAFTSTTIQTPTITWLVFAFVTAALISTKVIFRIRQRLVS